jgi:hypothetical protein
MSHKIVVTEREKRRVPCPDCGRAAGQPCVSSRIPGPNTFGGGWGGPPSLDRAHEERRKAYIETARERRWPVVVRSR